MCVSRYAHIGGCKRLVASIKLGSGIPLRLSCVNVPSLRGPKMNRIIAVSGKHLNEHIVQGL